MPLRVGLVTAAHLHVWSYIHALQNHANAEISGFWDDDAKRAVAFAEKTGLKQFATLEDLLSASDAVVIVSENTRHEEHAIAAARASNHILCEKPLAADAGAGKRMIDAAAQHGVQLMTAFPCRFSPAFTRLVERVRGGEIGAIKAVCATNRGRCPFDWFVVKEKSGGGAMIDHVVHVADLLRVLLEADPIRVQAQTSSNMYGKDWDDCAMLTLEYANGVFATIDSSWSRPQSFKTWGDVTMNVVGESGVIELDMFGQSLDAYFAGSATTHTLAGYGSDLDAAMVDAFIGACLEGRTVPVTGEDGLAAAQIAIAGYASLGLVAPSELSTVSAT